MAQQTPQQGSFWEAKIPVRPYPPLSGDLAVEVAVVGAGIAGLSTAWNLVQAGRKVAVLEAQQVGRQVTGHSTAKVTAQHGLVYGDLAKRFGEAGARAYAEANTWAIEEISRIVGAAGIDCAFERKDAWLVTTDAGRRAELEAEAAAATAFGLPSDVVEAPPFPPALGYALGIRCPGQAQFNPVAYCAGLARAIAAQGGQIFERTRVTAVENGGSPCRVHTAQGTVSAGAAVVATNLPVIKEGEFHKKARPRSHVGLAAPLSGPPGFDGMVLSLDKPTHSLRLASGPAGPVLIALGDGFPAGSDDPLAKLKAIRDLVSAVFPVGPVSHVWWNEDYDSIDRVPYIGHSVPRAQHVLVATGFSSWGFTNGTVAGRILSDTIQGKANPWAGLFDATRKPHGERQRGHQEPPVDNGRTPESLAPGQGALFDAGGTIVAAYRDPAGTLFVRSAKCTHLGCTVAWNPVNATWTCPCHGSAFDHQGRVVHGPAVADLPSVGNKSSS